MVRLVSIAIGIVLVAVAITIPLTSVEIRNTHETDQEGLERCLISMPKEFMVKGNDVYQRSIMLDQVPIICETKIGNITEPRYREYFYDPEIPISHYGEIIDEYYYDKHRLLDDHLIENWKQLQP